MTEKELKRLNRQELLEVLLAQSKKIDRLQKQLNEAKEKVTEREVKISEAGSIAEASLVLNHIFTDAQNAADQYLDNIRLMHKQAEKELAAAKAIRERAEAGADDFEIDELIEAAEEVTEADGPTEVAEEAYKAAGPTEVAEEVTEAAGPTEVAEEAYKADEAVEQVAEKISDSALKERLEAAESDRKQAAAYLEEIRMIKEQTDKECAEKKKRTDKQIRVSLIRTKKAVHQMITLYADEVERRMKRLKAWDRQMEALHERKTEKRSSQSHK